jgi:hypothetical protein
LKDRLPQARQARPNVELGNARILSSRPPENVGAVAGWGCFNRRDSSATNKFF